MGWNDSRRLRSIASGREGLVALCPMSPLRYLAERRWPSDPGWVPIGLAPARMANLRGHGRLFYYRDQVLMNETMRLARERGDTANWLLLKAA
jgi:hypothetical protein